MRSFAFNVNIFSNGLLLDLRNLKVKVKKEKTTFIVTVILSEECILSCSVVYVNTIDKDHKNEVPILIGIISKILITRP